MKSKLKPTDKRLKINRQPKKKNEKIMLSFRIDKKTDTLIMYYSKLFNKSKTDLIKLAVDNLLHDIIKSKPLTYL